MIRLRIILILIPLLTLTKAIGQIPAKVKQTADSIIFLRLGTEYSKLIKYDCEKSLQYWKGIAMLNGCDKNAQTKKKKKKGKTKGNELIIDEYMLTYRLTFQPNCHFDFVVRLDNKHRLKDKLNLPDCVNTSACDIKVDSVSAIDLAIKSGLEKGLGIYNTGLVLDKDTQTFQWALKNHLKTGPDKGDLIYIDSRTGERIRTKDQQWLRSVVH
jgi:hypothetical protein